MSYKILVIEDDHDILDILEYVLKDDGYQVISSTTGSVMQEINTMKPDLILLDEWLGENEKGSVLCRALKAQIPTSHIPVIIISALTPIELIAQTAKADGYIKKPFDIDEVSKKVKHFLPLYQHSA